MENALRALELLTLYAKECREAQDYYFKNRMQENLRIAKQKEKRLDDLITLLIKRGVKPQDEREKVEQKKLFE